MDGIGRLEAERVAVRGQSELTYLGLFDIKSGVKGLKPYHQVAEEPASEATAAVTC